MSASIAKLRRENEVRCRYRLLNPRALISAGCNASLAAASVPMVETTHSPIKFRHDFLWRFNLAIWGSRRTPRLESASTTDLIDFGQIPRNRGQAFPPHET